MSGVRSAAALATSLMAVALLWPTMVAAQDRPAQALPAMVNGRPVPALLGVWRSRGYGYVVRITADGPTLFHVAGGFCYPDPRPERDPDNLFEFYRPLGPDTVAFSSDAGADPLRLRPAAGPARGVRRSDAMVAAAHRGAGGGDLRRPLSVV